MSGLSRFRMAKRFKSLGAFLPTGTAIAALVFSAITFQMSVSSDRENQSRIDWSKYLEMAAESPNISKTGESIGGNISELDRETFFRYADRMYYYMDNVSSSGDRKWRNIVDRELHRHRKFVCRQREAGSFVHGVKWSDWYPGEINQYSAEFRSILSDFYARNCKEPK